MTPEQIKALPLGAPVTYNATLTRTQKHVKGWRVRKEWTRFELGGAHPAVFVGWRTLVDGWRDAEDEVGYVFEPDAATRQVAALVAYDARCNPILIPCDALVCRDTPALAWQRRAVDAMLLLDDAPDEATAGVARRLMVQLLEEVSE